MARENCCRMGRLSKGAGLHNLYCWRTRHIPIKIEVDTETGFYTVRVEL